MRFSIASLALILFFVTACGTDSSPSETSTSSSDEQLVAQQAAWAKMMEAHDRVMPMMNDMYAAGKELKPLIESAQTEANDFHSRATTALAEMEAAEDSMMNWMQNIGQNKLEVLRERYDHAGIMAYIEKELLAIEEVEGEMKNSLHAALKLIEERSTTIE